LDSHPAITPPGRFLEIFKTAMSQTVLKKSKQKGAGWRRRP